MKVLQDPSIRADAFKVALYDEFSSADDNEAMNPTEYILYQNYPNPFNPTTKIKFSIPNDPSTEGRNLNVKLKVYDVLGNEVAVLVDKEKSAGVYEVNFDASGLTSGVYFYKLTSGSFTESKKMMLLK